MANRTRSLSPASLLIGCLPFALSAAAYAQLVTNPTGGGADGIAAPIDTRQPGLALHMVVQTQGQFGIGVPIRMFAYADAAMVSYATAGGGNPTAGWPVADGRLAQINTNQALFSQLGTMYGGNGTTNFALPDLRGRSMMGESSTFPRAEASGSATATLTLANLPVHAHAYPLSPTGMTNAAGSGLPFSGLQPALAVNPVVMTAGVFPGQNGPFAALAVSPTAAYYTQVQFLASSPVGSPGNSRAPLAGTSLSIQSNIALFSLMGTAFGGNGTTHFNLPDLRGRFAVSRGAGPGLTERFLAEQYGELQTTLYTPNLPAHTHTVPGRPTTGSAGSGSPFSNAQPTVALTYFIAVNGIYPTANSMSDQSGYIGEVIAMTVGSDFFVPSGYLRCDGTVLPIAEYESLFALLGTTYGGNGTSTFALPDLRGRVPVGAQIGVLPAGTRVGAETTTLASVSIPPHVHTISCPADFGRAGGLMGQDNTLDNNDFIAYISLFFAASPLADIGRAGGLPGVDGAFDNNDFIAFINRFFAPC